MNRSAGPKAIFYTSHSLVNTTTANINASINDSFTFPIVQKGSEYVVWVERLEISTNTIPVIPAITNGISVNGVDYDINACYTWGEFVQFMTGTFSYFTLDIDKYGFLRWKVDDTVPGVIVLSDALAALTHFPANVTSAPAGGFGQPSLWRISGSPRVDVDNLCTVRLTTTMNVRSELYDGGHTANTLIELAPSNPLTVFNIKVTDNVNRQTWHPNFAETLRQRITYTSSGDKRLANVVDDGPMRYISLGVTWQDMSDDSFQHVLAPQGVFRVKLGWQKK